MSSGSAGFLWSLARDDDMIIDRELYQLFAIKSLNVICQLGQSNNGMGISCAVDLSTNGLGKILSREGSRQGPGDQSLESRPWP